MTIIIENIRFDNQLILNKGGDVKYYVNETYVDYTVYMGANKTCLRSSISIPHEASIDRIKEVIKAQLS